MQYDPIKDKLATYVSIFPVLRKLFYHILDQLLLRQRYVKREIKRYFRDGFSFYDAGAGFCQYSDFVLKAYPKAEVFACDIKSDYIESYAAIASDHFSFDCADLQCFVPPKHYNLAIAIDILEHIEDDISVLQNLHSALFSDGILIISTPSDMDEAAAFAAEHVRPGYRKADLEQKLIDTGFEIVSSRFSYGFWGAISWNLMIKTPLSLYARHKLLCLLWPLYYAVIFLPAQLFMLLDMLQDNPRGTGIILVARKKN
ncbi:MAG: methyltransferase domain-containing protein [Candidatus Cloacimonetes bacterium]|jgi:SAM-dependent methyltransferase|nr:class I SAM-dependent methyltransferase [Candidatus Cloacimonadota bacterium]MDD2506418.1 methyltransferase domain-containing protein [Candidatus Cloacimonadota bacterium]MDD4559769.1 methyltransferase domain-containing protein [Candidatus Cloacimonadota bacterium]